jgi:hypothetical protein
MGKFDEYNINLKALETDSTEFKFQLGNLFLRTLMLLKCRKEI